MTDVAVLVSRPGVAERFARHHTRTDIGCWLWTGGLDRYGYGKFGAGRRTHIAHRVAYLIHVGPIPDGLTIDHLCQNKACVNPAHLEPVTLTENIRRGEAARRVAGNPKHNSAKTHCPAGHPYDGDNLYVNRDGSRKCRACNREATRRYQKNKTASPQSAGKEPSLVPG